MQQIDAVCPWFKVKEVGVSLEDCSCLAQDARRIFAVYWSLGGANASLPPFWPARLSALSSAHNPLRLRLNGVPARVYLSVGGAAEQSRFAFIVCRDRSCVGGDF